MVLTAETALDLINGCLMTWRNNKIKKLFGFFFKQVNTLGESVSDLKLFSVHCTMVQLWMEKSGGSVEAQGQAVSKTQVKEWLSTRQQEKTVLYLKNRERGTETG